jgi:hypothetical protein
MNRLLDGRGGSGIGAAAPSTAEIIAWILPAVVGGTADRLLFQ